MDSDRFEAYMRRFEYFHDLRLLPETWTVIRVDGRGFSRLTTAAFDKPFDARFHDLMVGVATTLLEELGGIYAYTESDEISVLFPRNWDLFDRELEKLVSVSAALASAAFTHAHGASAHFDSRVWLGPDAAHVVDYFKWRMADCARCALNGWSYWTLREEGQSARAATRTLDGLSTSAKHELLFARGVNFAELPTWQRRGTGLYWESYEKEGYNPVTKETVTAMRRRVKIDRDLPMGEGYEALIRGFLIHLHQR
jgi:tRNA(His) guanylyltransferase